MTKFTVFIVNVVIVVIIIGLAVLSVHHYWNWRTIRKQIDRIIVIQARFDEVQELFDSCRFRTQN